MAASHSLRTDGERGRGREGGERRQRGSERGRKGGVREWGRDMERVRRKRKGRRVHVCVYCKYTSLLTGRYSLFELRSKYLFI